MHRKILLSCFNLLVISYMVLASVADSTKEIILKGHYYDENLIIMNPVLDNRFSVEEVFVNEHLFQDEFRSSAFEIDFSRYGIATGDTVTVKIRYSFDTGKPEIFNPDALKKRSAFRFKDVECDSRAMNIRFTVEGNDLSEPFEIEHYRWDKWLTVKLVLPEETSTYPIYTVPIEPHSGRNLFRVKYIDSEGNIHYSNDVRYTSKNREVKLVSDKVRSIIEFTEETMYQLFDKNGGFILDGRGNSVDIEHLEKGSYFLNFDNQTVVVNKR
jgi:hypothetical protein